MTPKVLADILSRHAGGVRDGDALRFEKNTRVTVFVSLGQEALTVDQVVEVVTEDDIVVFRTQREERYVVFYEDIRGVRLAPSRDKRAAFV